jgi:hypothetical protein
VTASGAAQCQSAGFSSTGISFWGGSSATSSIVMAVPPHALTRPGVPEHKPKPNATPKLDGDGEECLRQGGYEVPIATDRLGHAGGPRVGLLEASFLSTAFRAAPAAAVLASSAAALPLIHRRRAGGPLWLAESKRGARSRPALAPGRAVAVTFTSHPIRFDPRVLNDLGRATSPMSSDPWVTECLLLIIYGPKHERDLNRLPSVPPQKPS